MQERRHGRCDYKQEDGRKSKDWDDPIDGEASQPLLNCVLVVNPSCCGTFHVVTNKRGMTRGPRLRSTSESGYRTEASGHSDRDFTTKTRLTGAIESRCFVMFEVWLSG